jgi:hypothetical protein
MKQLFISPAQLLFTKWPLSPESHPFCGLTPKSGIHVTHHWQMPLPAFDMHKVTSVQKVPASVLPIHCPATASPTPSAFE